MKTFKKICRKNQEDLKKWLERLLKAKYKGVVNGDGYLYAKGNVPILLTAHMDTVHKEQCKIIMTEKREGKTILSSPQGIGGDDRCGIWIIWMVLTKTKYRPSILFCEDEEIGGVGSDKFCTTDYVDDLTELKYLIELDRANDNDAVYYSCGNADFKGYITQMIGYETAYGSFSDISHLSPECDKASVNLSCGYYNAHTLKEYVVYEEMYNTFKAVKVLLSDAKECEAYDYQEERYWDKWKTRSSYDDWFEDSYGNFRTNKTTYEFIFNDENGNEEYDFVDADTIEEALGLFFFNNPDRCYNNIIDYYTVSDYEAV